MSCSRFCGGRGCGCANPQLTLAAWPARNTVVVTQAPAPAPAPSASVSKETENELRALIKTLQATMTTEVGTLKKEVASLKSELEKERSIRKRWVQLEQDRTKQLAALM